MCVSGFRPAAGKLQRDPSDRNPVPQSRMNCVPSGATSSRQGVFPPYLQVAGSTVGVEPRTPQKLSLAMGTVISLVVQFWLEAPSNWRTVLLLMVAWRYIPSNDSAQAVVIVPNKQCFPGTVAALLSSLAYNGPHGPAFPCARRRLQR